MVEFDVLLALVALITGAVLAYFARDTHTERMVMRLAAYNEDLEAELRDLRMAAKGARGNIAQEQKKEQLEAAMMEAVSMFKEGSKPEEIIKSLVTKYPGVAMQLAKKGLKL